MTFSKNIFSKIFNKEKKPLTLTRRRFISIYIDFLIIFAIVCSVYLILNSFSSIYLKPYLSNSGEYLFSSHFKQMISPIFLLTIFNYFFISIFLSNGNTFGTTIMNLQIVQKTKDNDDQKISFNQAFLRAAIYTLSITFMYLPFLFNLFTKNNLGFADYLTSSKAALFIENEQNIDQLNLNSSSNFGIDAFELNPIPIENYSVVQVNQQRNIKKAA